MKKTLLGLAALCLLLSAQSCKKDKDPVTPSPAPAPAPAPVTKRALLTSGKWIVASMTFSEPGRTDIDLYNTVIEACEKDDHYQFQADGKTMVFENGNKCTAGGPASYQDGTWALISNDTKLVSKTDEGNDTAAITELSASVIRLKKDFEYFGRKGTYSVSFNKVP